jgi:endonuclease V-like protein UPF0215 family
MAAGSDHGRAIALWPRRYARTVNAIGFDDGPFPREHRGDVLLVGVVCSGTRIDGIVSGRVRRDGADATRRMVELVRASQFGAHVQAIMLQGIAVGGFNVVDIQGLYEALHIPVLVVVRRPPDMAAVHRALFSDVPTTQRPRVAGATRKWQLIQRAGELERIGPSRRSLKRASGLTTTGPKLWIQRAGLSIEQARRIIAATTLHGNIPEPLRVAHLIAGGITTGASRGRA